MAQTNIFSDVWCDLVVDQRLKDYGAFVIRRDSSKRHRLALIVTVVFFILAILAPGFIKSIIPEKKEVNVEVTALANIDLERIRLKNLNNL